MKLKMWVAVLSSIQIKRPLSRKKKVENNKTEEYEFIKKKKKKEMYTHFVFFVTFFSQKKEKKQPTTIFLSFLLLFFFLFFFQLHLAAIIPQRIWDKLKKFFELFYRLKLQQIKKTSFAFDHFGHLLSEIKVKKEFKKLKIEEGNKDVRLLIDKKQQ